ncbi:MAG: NAD(P)H-dependent oxidoreductase [Proteobacteria bacterium]|nr:NAD(P)H-dependent oxidoreductase [Pseudomonadota bacterium]
MARNVAVIIGSLRKESFSRKLANALIPLSKPALDLKLIEIADLQLYSEDTEKNPPREWIAFRDAVRPADAVLFVTPEYNRSVPGCLKNAIDVGSRPYGSSVWSGKPACVISNSPGNIGGFGANHHLRQSLVFLDMPVLQQPEAYIAGANKLVNDKGEIEEQAKRDFLTKIMQTFAGWIEKTASK